MEKSHSWLDMANLTHETQVMEFNFCLCEEQEQFPYEDYRKALEESMKELQNLKTINQEFIDIRNVAITNLYGIGYSAIELAEITNLTRQMIHNIVKGK